MIMIVLFSRGHDSVRGDVNDDCMISKKCGWSNEMPPLSDGGIGRTDFNLKVRESHSLGFLEVWVFIIYDLAARPQFLKD